MSLTKILIAIALMVAGISSLIFFDRPRMYRKMRNRQRSGRHSFEEMTREEFGEAYSRLVIIPSGLGTFYLFINIVAIGLLVAGIFLMVPFNEVQQQQQATATEIGESYHLEIRIREGKWPVGSYQKASMDAGKISFDYPEGWIFDVMPEYSQKDSQSETGGSSSTIYGNEFIYASVDMFSEDSPFGFGLTENTSLDPQLRLFTDNISGLKIVESEHTFDQATNLFNGQVFAFDTKKSIKVDFISSSGRTLEEYVAVIDRFIDTLRIDFSQIPTLPGMRPPLESQ